MKSLLRSSLIKELWNKYKQEYYPNQMDNLIQDENIFLDHLAIIDLNTSGRNELEKVLKKIGFKTSGHGYLPEKNNPFLWMREEDHEDKSAHLALPQVIFADFNVEDFSPNVKSILLKYSSKITPIDNERLNYYLAELEAGKSQIIKECAKFIADYLTDKPWGTPTRDEYLTVAAENELVAWTLLFGRKINHFGISIHLVEGYQALDEFNYKLVDNGISLNNKPTLIKGGEYCGISQSSSIGNELNIELKGGKIKAYSPFMEFVWRYPTQASPKLNSDYYMDFVPVNANKVVESLYTKRN